MLRQKPLLRHNKCHERSGLVSRWPEDSMLTSCSFGALNQLSVESAPHLMASIGCFLPPMDKFNRVFTESYCILAAGDNLNTQLVIANTTHQTFRQEVLCRDHAEILWWTSTFSVSYLFSEAIPTDWGREWFSTLSWVLEGATWKPFWMLLPGSVDLGHRS